MLCAVSNGVQQLAVNDQALRRAWESSQRSTKEDWAEWMRHFAVELLKESPSHALRATHLLAQVCRTAPDTAPSGHQKTKFDIRSLAESSVKKKTKNQYICTTECTGLLPYDLCFTLCLGHALGAIHLLA